MWRRLTNHILLRNLCPPFLHFQIVDHLVRRWQHTGLLRLNFLVYLPSSCKFSNLSWVSWLHQVSRMLHRFSFFSPLLLVCLPSPLSWRYVTVSIVPSPRSAWGPFLSQLSTSVVAMETLYCVKAWWRCVAAHLSHLLTGRLVLRSLTEVSHFLMFGKEVLLLGHFLPLHPLV